MNIHIVLVLYALDVVHLVSSLHGPDTFFHIFTHSHRDEIQHSVDLIRSTMLNASVHDYGANRGLARSWNDGIVDAYRQGADLAVVVNDDVLMTRADLAILVRHAINHREAGIVVVNGQNQRMGGYFDLGYSVFAINPVALGSVGAFDVNYWPIYGEDVDYSRRCTLAGVPIQSAGDTGVVHTGSVTSAVDADLRSNYHARFSANEAYHRAKHGGGYGEEVFQNPFNDPALNWFIPAHTRNSPYPGHDRTDVQEIVKL